MPTAIPISGELSGRTGSESAIGLSQSRADGGRWLTNWHQFGSAPNLVNEQE